MSYPTILLLLDDDPHARARNEAAIEFALRCGAHLHGLACHVAVPTGPEFAVAPGGPNDPVRRDLEEGERQAVERALRFGQSCERRRVASFETSLDDSGEPAHAVLRRAPVHDLVLLGQPDPVDPDVRRRNAVVEDIVLRSPRPTLVHPYARDVLQLAGRALIAWDGSHGAARAAADALPLLRGCRDVRVAQFYRGSRIPACGQSPLAGFERWLRRHGIEAHAGVHYSADDIGLALLSHAGDVAADLLVMGSWGQGPWRERLLGGVTRTVLASARLPVITSR